MLYYQEFYETRWFIMNKIITDKRFNRILNLLKNSSKDGIEIVDMETDNYIQISKEEAAELAEIIESNNPLA